MGERTHAERVTTPAIGLASRRKTLPAKQVAPRIGHDFSAVPLHAGPMILRAAAVSGNGGGDNGCFNLLNEIIEWSRKVSQRISDALADIHDLWKFYRSIGNPHPDGYGSWDGHVRFFNREQGELRYKLGEWDSNDDCRGLRLSPEQQTELDKAREVSEQKYPERPAKNLRLTPLPDPGLRDRIAKLLISIGIPVAVVGGLTALVIAALADPEPFSKVALLLGSAAAIALFVLLGRRNETRGGPMA
jgi:hypothetical protein